MNQIFRTCIFKRYVNHFLKESRRCAGHSKWQNIKHQKEENDANRNDLFTNLRRKMKAAILEGGSAKPIENANLARLIEQCKKANMPAASINDFLKKHATSKEANQSALVQITGPRNCSMVIKLISDNIVDTKTRFKSVLRKINARVIENSFNSVFNHTGYLIVENTIELEKAMEDAINVGAIDIEEIQDDNNTYYKFKCEPHLLPKITTQLKNLNYNIITTKEEIIPISTMKFSDEDLQIIKLAQEKLLKFDEVHEIYDNVDHNVTSN